MPPCLRAAVLAAVLAASGLPAAGDAPKALPRSTPEKQGIPSAALERLVGELDRIGGMHGLMVVRHGHVVAEGWWAPYDADTPHMLFSLSKSFTSAAVGFAVAEGRIRVSDPVAGFFPEDLPKEPSAPLRAMRIQDLLTMSTGHQDEPPTRPDRMSAQSFLAQPVPHKPGTHFKYNTAATFMASAIVQKRTGQKVVDYLQPRLFGPLGIAAPRWDETTQGINLGGYGLFLRTEDIAKFGQLQLQRGRWEGRQLLPAAWVDAATSRQVSNGSNPDSDWDQGYGYQFWRCRNGAYRGDGAFGQFCVVLPEQDSVVAITSGVGDMQGVLDVLWKHLLPAFRPGRLPADRKAAQALSARLRSLEVARPVADPGANPPPGAVGRTYRFPETSPLRSLRLEEADGGWRLVRDLDGRESVLPIGRGRWVRGRGWFGLQPAGPLVDPREEPLAAAGAWTAPGRFQFRLCGLETPFHLDFRMEFSGDEVRVSGESNVGFGERRLPVSAGTARP